ncbi:hypothetical protein CPB86DRAFT_826299 [Serendipita vermifera]|nr:hypothetical protein CPB86DRAFT_826299 [Serendipita vermifera]
MRSFIPLSEESPENTPSQQDLDSLTQNALYAFSLLQLTPRKGSSHSHPISSSMIHSNAANSSPNPPTHLSPPSSVEPTPPATPSPNPMSNFGTKASSIPLKRFISASEGKRKASSDLHRVTHKRRRTEDRLDFQFLKGKGKARESNILAQRSSMSSASSPEDSESSPGHSTPEYPLSPISHAKENTTRLSKYPNNPFRGPHYQGKQLSSSSKGTRAIAQDKTREISKSIEVINLSDSSTPSMDYIELSD